MKVAVLFFALLLVACQEQKIEQGQGQQQVESLAEETAKEPVNETVKEPEPIVESVPEPKPAPEQIAEPKSEPENDILKMLIPELIKEVPVPEPESELLLQAKAEDFSKLPANAKANLPHLREVAERKWPEYKTPSVFAAQVEKESCKTLTHVNCWGGKAELKTTREYGFGLGQITIAYDANGKIRFNKFEEIKQLDSELKGWNYADRYDTYRQSMALVILNRANYNAIKKYKPADETTHTAMMLVSYNGGLGGLASDISLCKAAKGCDPTLWFGHVEKYTKKSKVKFKGYGSSVADINRLYPFDILYNRRPKYLEFFDDKIVHLKLVNKPHQF